MRKAVWFILVALPLAGCQQGASTTVSKVEQPTQPKAAAALLSAGKLCDDYKSGEATADGNYKGKEIELQGSVMNVSKDPGGRAFLVLRGSGGGNVRCYFLSDQADKVGQMKSGADIKVKGVCKGRMGGFGDAFDVELNACKLMP